MLPRVPYIARFNGLALEKTDTVSEELQKAIHQFKYFMAVHKQYIVHNYIRQLKVVPNALVRSCFPQTKLFINWVVGVGVNSVGGKTKR